MSRLIPCFYSAIAACLLFSATVTRAEDAVSQESAAAKLSLAEVKDFETNIRPLLVKRCVSCHGADKQKGGIRFDLRTSAIELGGESGPAIVPGHPDDSLLVEAIRYDSFEMPPEGQLPDKEIEILVDWIKRGAPWPADNPHDAAQLSGSGITDEDRAYWAFQPMQDSRLPTVAAVDWPQQPIDHFVLARLEQAKLTPADPAEKADLLRRVHYDVTGLPPTPQQMRDFLADESPDAYAKVVDRLLASSQFGEHMARYWLDLVRYAESDGYRQDAYRPQAWRYRDYVIEAFNSDKPYDQFLTEQLAGDEFAPEDPAALVATGFLRHGVYEYNQRDVRTHWQEIVNEMTDVTGDVFLGLGMGCARCHNHKFDPILQEDYFALQAFFTPVIWDDNAPLATPQEIARYEAQLKVWEEATADIRAKINEIEQPVLDSLAEGQIKMFPEDIQAMMRKPVEQREPLEHQLAELAWRQVLFKQTGLIYKLKGDTRKAWDALKAELKEFDDIKPKSLPVGPTARDVGPQAPATVLATRRGEREIPPHFLTVMTNEKPEILPPENQPSTGRRLALAEWLTRPEHPLTARVMVNRIWQQHFGTGLVASASDFGTLGEPPSHPELLDWLALRFIESGWSMKQMHRMLLLSATYQQSSQASGNPRSYEAAMLTDPQNRLLWRMTAERLNADQIRDSILVATGELDAKQGGPSVAVNSQRRSIYTKLMRNNQDPFFTAFDAPRGTSSVSERNRTVTSTQALLLMNGPWMLKRAETLAGQLLRDLPDEPDTTQLQTLVDTLYWETLQREPTATESAQIVEYILTELSNGITEPKLGADSLAKFPVTNSQALSLTDQSTQLRPFTNEALLDGNSDFTVEAIVFLDSLYPTASVRTIAAQWNNDHKSAGWSLGVTSEKSAYKPRNLILQLIGKTANTEIGYEVVASNLRIELKTPYYVGVSVDLDDTSQNGITFYAKNLKTGELQTAQAKHTVTAQFVNPATRIVVGGRDSDKPQFWHGDIDELRISTARLNREELLFEPNSQSDQVVGHWKFELEPHLLHDSSAAGNSLSLTSEPGGHRYSAPVTDVAHMLLNSNEFLYLD